MNNVSLTLDPVAWIAARPRTYREVMGAWRSSCPRLTIWEDALEAGLLRMDSDGDAGQQVSATAVGNAFLLTNERVAQ